ncbi:MAG: hypothetical protein ACREQ5_03455, partial [Candidatus Dormibacteria bacterium]
ASGEAPLSTPGATEYVPTAEEIEVNHQERLASIRETMKTISVEEDIKALFAGSNLSEEFKTNAKTIFEAAVVARAVVVVEQIEQDMIAASEAAVNEIREELEGNVDKYLDHMVVEWMEQNQVAIESGLKAELVEEFIDGLRTLFIEHNMNIPEDSVPVVEQLTARVEELQAKLDETLNTNIVLSKSLAKGQKAKTLVTACEGLTATQAEKLKTLAEGVEFTTEGEYAGKVKVIRDQYFSTTVKVGGKAPAVLVEAADEATAVEGSSLTGSMAAYSETITRTVRK